MFHLTLNIHSSALKNTKLTLIFWKNSLIWNFKRSFYKFLIFFRTNRRFLKNKSVKNESSFKIHGGKRDNENLKSFFRIAPKNLKKFVVIHYEKMYLHAYFHIFLSSRVLKGKNFLTINFSPCYSNGKLRPFGGGGQISQIGPSDYMEYFLLFFWKLFTWWHWWKSRFGK